MRCESPATIPQGRHGPVVSVVRSSANPWQAQSKLKIAAREMIGVADGVFFFHILLVCPMLFFGRGGLVCDACGVFLIIVYVYATCLGFCCMSMRGASHLLRVA